MTYLKLLLAALGLLSSWVKYLERQGLLKDGEARAILKGLEQSNAEVEIARKARDSARKYNELNPDRVSDDDGFRRD